MKFLKDALIGLSITCNQKFSKQRAFFSSFFYHISLRPCGMLWETRCSASRGPDDPFWAFLITLVVRRSHFDPPKYHFLDYCDFFLLLLKVYKFHHTMLVLNAFPAISEGLKLKIFLGSIPPDSPKWHTLTRSNSSAPSPNCKLASQFSLIQPKLPPPRD